MSYAGANNQPGRQAPISATHTLHQFKNSILQKVKQARQISAREGVDSGRRTASFGNYQPKEVVGGKKMDERVQGHTTSQVSVDNPKE